MEGISCPEISLRLKFNLMLLRLTCEGQRQVVLGMFLNFDKDSYKIGSYPIIKKLRNRPTPIPPKQKYYILSIAIDTQNENENNTQKLLVNSDNRLTILTVLGFQPRHKRPTFLN